MPARWCTSTTYFSKTRCRGRKKKLGALFRSSALWMTMSSREIFINVKYLKKELRNGARTRVSLWTFKTFAGDMACPLQPRTSEMLDTKSIQLLTRRQSTKLKSCWEAWLRRGSRRTATKNSSNLTKMEISSKWLRALQMSSACSSKLMPSLLIKMELIRSQIWIRRLSLSHGHTTTHLRSLTHVSTTMATPTVVWMPLSGVKSPQAPHPLHQSLMRMVVLSSTLARSHLRIGIILLVWMVLIKTRIWCKKRAKLWWLIIHRV